MKARRPLTFGQQALRLSVSATACGLSLAYILGAQITHNLIERFDDSGISAPAAAPFFSLANLASSIDWSQQFTPPPTPVLVMETPAPSPVIEVAVPAAPKVVHVHKRKHLVRRLKVARAHDKVIEQVAAVQRDERIPVNSESVVYLDKETMVSPKAVGIQFPELYELLLSDKFAYEHFEKRLTKVDTQVVAVTNQQKTLEQAPDQSAADPKKSILAVVGEETATAEVPQEKREDDIPSLASLPSIKAPEYKEDLTMSGFSVIDFHKQDAKPDAQNSLVATLPNEPKAAPVPVNNQATFATHIIESDGLVRVQGRILASDAYPGHVEVGFYNSIDSDGNPVGAPIAWSALPESKNTYQLSLDPKTTQRGYLFAHYFAVDGSSQWIASDKNPLSLPGLSFAQADFRLSLKDKLSTIMSAGEHNNKDGEFVLRGRISTMFATDNTIEGAVLRVRGSKLQTKSSAGGEFQFKLPSSHGSYLIEVSKAGYLPSIFVVSPRENNSNRNFELISQQLLNKLAFSVGLRQGSLESAMIVKVTNEAGEGLPGFSAQLGLKADGPFYFTKDGIPTREAKMTGFDGRMIFFNIASGVGNLELGLANGDSVAPLSLSAIEGGEFIYQELQPIVGKLDGRIFDATEKKPRPLQGARVRVEGSSEWATSDAYGNFSLPQVRYLKNKPVQLEVNHDGYYAHGFRTYISSDHEKPANLFMFPMSYINGLANRADIDLDPYSGIIFGNTRGGVRLRMDALSDHSNINNAKDFYFDQKQDLLGSHSFTDEKFGTYVIFNVPKGRAMIYGHDNTGALRYSRVSHISASTVHVLLPEE